MIHWIAMGRLLVNADDFGLTHGVNRAILELHREGLLASATLMANAEATGEAIEIALAQPALGVGCHIVLLNGAPVLSASRIPTLIDRRTDIFWNRLTEFCPRLIVGAISAAEIEDEAAAQIERLQASGVRLTHIDTHKHVHAFPQVLRPVLRAAKAAGIRAVRNPFEPRWSISATKRATKLRRLKIMAQRMLRSAFLRIVEEEGFKTTDGSIGITATGHLDAGAVKNLIENLPCGTWELVTHPGYNDADLARVRTRLRASRDVERLALTAIREVPGIELISFAELETSVPATPSDLLTC